MARDSHGNLAISGTVANNGEVTANTVSVIATPHDKRGDVAAASRTNPEPDYLRAGDGAFFVLPVPDKAQTGGVGDHVPVAESEECAAVQEFPVVAVLLALTLSAYVGIARYSGRIIAVLSSAADPG